MAVYNVNNIRAGGGTGLHGSGAVKLANAIGELQSLRLSVVTGGVAASTNMTLTGVKVGDTILSAIEESSTNGVSATHAGVVTITAANTIQSTAATTGKNLIVVWLVH